MTRAVVEEVRATGGVKTTLGRFLRVPRDQAYAGVNYKIQGTAAQILKRAQARVHAWLERETDGEAGLLMPIHDELIIEWPRRRLGQAQAGWREIRSLMIDFPQFNVPLDVEVDVSTESWAKKKSFDFKEE
jgi:DNA polymerase-1